VISVMGRMNPNARKKITVASAAAGSVWLYVDSQSRSEHYDGQFNAAAKKLYGFRAGITD
jgi:hypothetical protein